MSYSEYRSRSKHSMTKDQYESILSSLNCVTDKMKHSFNFEIVQMIIDYKNNEIKNIKESK